MDGYQAAQHNYDGMSDEPTYRQLAALVDQLEDKITDIEHELEDLKKENNRLFDELAVKTRTVELIKEAVDRHFDRMTGG